MDNGDIEQLRENANERMVERDRHQERQQEQEHERTRKRRKRDRLIPGQRTRARWASMHSTWNPSLLAFKQHVYRDEMGYNVFENNTRPMRTNRRQFIMGVGTAVAGLSMGSSVLATGHTPLYFETVDREGDFVVIGNAGDEDFDLSGHIIDWEYNQQQDQTDEIPSGIVVPAGGTVKLASGYDEAGAADADHDFGYEAGRIRDDGTDTIAIHEPGMEALVITSGDHQDPPEDPNGDDGDNGGGDGGDNGDNGDGGDNGDVDDGDDGDDDRDDDGDGGDDRDEEDEGDREAEPEEEEVEGEDCPEEESEEEESDDDDCPEEEPEPEPEEEDCP